MTRIPGLLLLLFVSFPAVALEKILMEPGDARVIQAEKDRGLRLSQKNVVEVEPMKDGAFRLLAVRSGLVHIRSGADGKGPSWFVEVQQRDPDKLWLAKDRWRNFFCREPGVRCDPEAGLITGTSDDLSWFHQARTQCLKRGTCRFLVRMSPRGIQSWTSRIKSYASNAPVEIDDDGRVWMERDCTKDPQFEHLKKTLDDVYGIELQATCKKQEADTWALDVLAVARRRRASEQSNPLRWKILEMPMHKDLSAVIAGISSNTDLSIIARPTLLLSPGASVTLADGMEIQTLAVQKESAEVLWKPVGFHLDVHFLEARDAALHLQIALSLSRAQEGLRTVEASQLRSELWLDADRFVLVGTIDARMESRDESRIPWISSIPFLGALFTWKEEGQGKSEVELYMRVKRGGLNPPGEDQKDNSSETEEQDR